MVVPSVGQFTLTKYAISVAYKNQKRKASVDILDPVDLTGIAPAQLTWLG